MTTNHKERLDPALIRPGRVDLQVEFRTALIDEVVAMHKRFIPDATREERIEFSVNCVPHDTMADVQNRLMAMAMGPRKLKAQ